MPAIHQASLAETEEFDDKQEPNAKYNEYVPNTLERALSSAPGRVIGIQLPPTRTQTNARIPIEYRTLSIHVYDSQRFGPDTQAAPRSAKRSFLGKQKTSASGSTDDADFFSRLDFHKLSPLDISQRLSVSPVVGLDTSAAAKRLERNGRNSMSQKKNQYWKKILRYLFGDFCSILWVGVVIFFISWRPLGNPPAPYNLALAIVVILVIFLQAIFSALQDWSSQRIMNSILNLLPENAVVLRDGQSQSIPSAELVVGDIVQLNTGQKVPADIRIIKASNDLRFDRSILTGESEEITGTVDSTENNFLEAHNIALLGTYVCNGTATGIVVLTGSRTVMGRINLLTNSATDQKTNLQREITRFVMIIIALTLTLVTIMLITWLAWLRKDHYEFLNVVGILTNLMSLVVAFIPEGMPIAVALTLSLIARRMRDAKVLPKSLSTVETLGCVNVVCSDKTGTLTKNEMSVVSLASVEEAFKLNETDHLSSATFEELRKVMVICNDAKIDPSSNVEDPKILGNATDGALLRFAACLPGGVDKITKAYVREFDLPFNSTNKFALTYSRSIETEKSEILVKGAPDILLQQCDTYLAVDGTRQLDSTARQALVALQEQWSRRGERVILLAQRQYSPRGHPGSADFEEELISEAGRSLTVVGLVGIFDPPRSDTRHTVSEVRRCGSRFFMVTGDFSLTACAIAREIGIFSRIVDPDRVADFDSQGRLAEMESVRDERLRYIDRSLLVEGKEITMMTQIQWDIICKYEEIVFARTTPEQKLKIVTELRERGCIVAVTGDGVNDAPALKAANVGIAMVSGSEVAMEAADLVLMGDFSSIIEGIRLGRLVFQNLQKVISYLLPAGSWSEDWPVILNVFFGCPLPLSSFLMIIICCFTDLFCCVTLIFEKEEFDLLSLPPRDPSNSHLINTRIYGQSYLFMGVMETVCAHAMFFLYMWQKAGIPMNHMFFAFEKYTDGYYGHTQAQLTQFLNTGQCVYFVTLVILQMFNLNSVRNKRQSIFQSGPQRNPKLIFGPIISLAIAIFVTEEKGLQNLFGTASVPIKFWLLPIPLGLGILMVDEVRKLAVRMWPKGPVAKLAW